MKDINGNKVNDVTLSDIIDGKVIIHTSTEEEFDFYFKTLCKHKPDCSWCEDIVLKGRWAWAHMQDYIDTTSNPIIIPFSEVRHLFEERNAKNMKNYFIKKGGCFYRKNNTGYTESVHRAGLYTKEEALRTEESTHGECRAVPVSMYRNKLESLKEIRNDVDNVINAIIGSGKGGE